MSPTGPGNDPSPLLSSHSHGTMVAGLAASRDLNARGGRGVAPRASLAGYNLLWSDGLTSTMDFQKAMTQNMAEVAISNNSWGVGGDGTGLADPPQDYLWHDGVAAGVVSGRGGKGIVYLWAAGNGGELGVDNSNYDYQANNRHVMAICAVDGDGRKALYSEEGANLWLCAPGGYYSILTTTDLTGPRGGDFAGVTDDYADRNYTKWFVGTSAATPLVSGVVALMLEANPALGWRDVRLILAETARKNDPTDGGWRKTVPASPPAPPQPSYNINHKYGFGVVDAAAAVARAKLWTTNVGPQRQRDFYALVGGGNISDAPAAGLSQTITVPAIDGLIIEYVEVEVSIVHGDPGDLEIVLTAPSGTQSVLANSHTCMVTTATTTSYVCPVNNYKPWTFGSSRHLGENSAGGWRLTVTDKRTNSLFGSLTSWTLRIYGRES